MPEGSSTAAASHPPPEAETRPTIPLGRSSRACQHETDGRRRLSTEKTHSASEGGAGKAPAAPVVEVVDEAPCSTSSVGNRPWGSREAIASVVAEPSDGAGAVGPSRAGMSNSRASSNMSFMQRRSSVAPVAARYRGSRVSPIVRIAEGSLHVVLALRLVSTALSCVSREVEKQSPCSLSRYPYNNR